MNQTQWQMSFQATIGKPTILDYRILYTSHFEYTDWR